MATLNFFKSNLNITGRFNNYLSQSLVTVVFLPLRIPALKRGFGCFCGWFFFLMGLFFHKPLCKLVVALQGSLLSPRELFLLDMQMDPNHKTPQNALPSAALGGGIFGVVSNLPVGSSGFQHMWIVAKLCYV